MTELSPELVERIAKSIHDSDGIADTTWPHGPNDDGSRGDRGYVRLCPNPEDFRVAAWNALAALRPGDTLPNGWVGPRVPYSLGMKSVGVQIQDKT